MKKTLTLFLIGLAGLFQAQNLLNGLQACYLFDANADNYAFTGATLNGVINNVSQATGHTNFANTAYSFSGDTGSYIKLPNDVRIKPNVLTFSGWFYIDSLPNEQYLVFAKNNCSSNFEAYSLITYFDPLLHQQVFRVSKSNNSCIYAPHVESITAPVIGNWYHIVFYIDNSAIKLYVNGVLEGSATHSILFDYDANKNVFLGCTHESNFNLPFKGRIDNVRFYNRALTLQEINLLFSQESSCAPSEVSLPEITTSSNSLNVHPNPGQGKIYFSSNFNDLTNPKVYIIDVLGREVENNIEKDNSIDLKEFVNGAYSLKIKAVAYEHVFKIIIQN